MLLEITAFIIAGAAVIVIAPIAWALVPTVEKIFDKYGR